MGAVDVHHKEIIAPHPHVPRAVELANNAVFQLEGRVATVIGGAFVGLASLVDTLRNVDRAEARNTFDRSEGLIDQVTPVAEHVDDDAAAVFLAVVPARALDGLVGVVTGENPVAEFAAHREDATEETLVDEQLQFADPGEPELVLDDAVFDPGVAAELGETHRFGRLDRSRFLTVDRLAGLDRLFDEPGTV